MRKILSIIIILALGACNSSQNTETIANNTGPEYSKPLQPGQRALTHIPTDKWPDLGEAWEERDLFLRDSLDNSIAWFDAPSSKQWFPIEGITHEQAKTPSLHYVHYLQRAKQKTSFSTN